MKEIVTTYAGRMNGGDFTWEFNHTVDDTASSVNIGLMGKIRNYTTKLISIGGNSGEVIEPKEPTDLPTEPTNPEVGKT